MQEALGTDRNDRNGFAQPSSIDPQSGRLHPTNTDLLPRSRRAFAAPMRRETFPPANACVQGDPQHGAGCGI